MLGFRGGFLLLCGGLALLTCSKEEGPQKDEGAKLAALKAAKVQGQTYLDVHFVLGSSLEELVARFGEPDAYRPQLGNQPYGNIKWKDLKGVTVFGIVKDSTCAYVNYKFDKLDPFDETEAFRIIGVERPDDDPAVSVLKTGVTKWYPFEHYHHLTVSPQQKNVSIKGFEFAMGPGTS